MTHTDLAARIGTYASRPGPHLSAHDADEAITQLYDASARAAEYVADLTQMQPFTASARVAVVDRPTWIAENLQSLDTLEPVLFADEPEHTLLGKRATALQLGAVLGVLSGRVLGQYDAFSPRGGQLLLLVQNILETEQKLRVNSDDFRLWVCLHELTHRTQFESVPWLHGYVLDQIRALSLVGDDGEGAITAMVQAGVKAVKQPDAEISLLDAWRSDEQREVVQRILAVMTLLEGHAEYVMDNVEAEAVPSVETIRARFTQRRMPANVLTAFLRRIFGVEMKLRQYAEGRRFVNEIVEHDGMDAFNTVWSHADALPSLSEIRAPETWKQRVVGA